VTEVITSPTNPRIKALVRLRDRRHRDRSGTFLVEGFRELHRALQGGVEIESLYVCPSLFLGENTPALVERVAATGAEVIEVAERAFRKVSYRDRPEGLLAVARQFPTDLGRIRPGPDPLVLVVESIEKPGNLGTMLRTADAAGASVVVCDPTTDPFNPNVVRASLGTLFLVPLAICTSREALEWARSAGMTIVATTPEGEDLYWDVDLRSGVALAIGSEQYGLTPTWLEGADVRVRIPMAGSADSLNAAMAAGIVLFEAVRQRQAAHRSDGA
jgi:TrmH family RNA methyltransferase